MLGEFGEILPFFLPRSGIGTVGRFFRDFFFVNFAKFLFIKKLINKNSKFLCAQLSEQKLRQTLEKGQILRFFSEKGP